MKETLRERVVRSRPARLLFGLGLIASGALLATYQPGNLNRPDTLVAEPHSLPLSQGNVMGGLILLGGVGEVITTLRAPRPEANTNES